MTTGLKARSTNATTNATRKFKWGIFEVAYDATSQSIPSLLRPNLFCFDYSFRYLPRFLIDIYVAAPRPFAFMILGYLWMSVAPSLLLYLSHTVLNIINTSTNSAHVVIQDGPILVAFVLAWPTTAILSSLIERRLVENKLILAAHLRAYFLPLLARASLHLDVRYNYSDRRILESFPNPWGFGEGAPALNFLTEASSRVRNAVTILLEVLVLVHIISVNNTDAWILKWLGVVFLAVIILAPSNGISGAGYTFWTNNAYYHRLCSLHSIIFQPKYRETLAKDGTGDYLYKEYRYATDALGVAKSDTFALAYHIPPPWYWALASTLMVDYPMAMYALTLPWSLSSTSSINIALFQYATWTLRQSLSNLRGYQDPSPLMSQIQRFYEVLDCEIDPDSSGSANYPLSSSSHKGVKLAFRNVSCLYKEPARLAVNNVSLDIEPGQLVVIVGENGSGKSSLLKLISRVNPATSGEIFVDDEPISNYDIHVLRKYMAFLTQSEEIYPISLSENLLMGLPDRPESQADKAILIDEAARLGGSYNLIQRLGRDTILNRPGVVGQSIKGNGNGDIGPGAVDALNQNSPAAKEIRISLGEKQRLVASRIFMRVKNSDIRLLVVDEPTSALDPIAEQDLFNNFYGMKKGKTIIFVTHRFGCIVKRADLILCMSKGVIVQRGTHDELMQDMEGEYWRLYSAQRW